MRLLITGASGLLGRKVLEKALERGFEAYAIYYNHPVNAGRPLKLNLADRNSVFRIFSDVKPGVVINTAALTDVDACEVDKDLALKINAEAAGYLAEASSKVGAYLVHVSTDYVFDGERGMYTEEDVPHPVNFYGYSKLMGEGKVKSLAKDWCIVRTSVLFGWGREHKANFAIWVVNGLRTGRRLNVVTDQYVSPTLSSNLADMILEIVERKLAGLMHTAGASRINRYDMALRIAEVFGLEKELLHPVCSDSIKWKAKRPKDSSLSVEKIRISLKTKPLNLTESLLHMKREETCLSGVKK